MSTTTKAGNAGRSLDPPRPKEPAAEQTPNDIVTNPRLWTPRAFLRLAALVVVAVLAGQLLDLLVRVTLPRFDAEAERATRLAAAWVEINAARQSQVMAETRQFLQTMAGLSSLPDIAPARCRAYIANQSANHPDYPNLGVVRRDGLMQCSLRPLALSADRGARLAEAAERNGLAILPGPEPGALLFAVPVGDKPGAAARSAVFALRALPGLEGLPAAEGGAGDLEVELFGHTGLILARRPDRASLTGTTRIKAALLEQAAKLGAGQGKLAGPDGVKRYYAFVPVEGRDADRYYLAAGLPVAAVHADTRRTLYYRSAGLALLLAALALLAGIGGDRFLQRRLAAIPNPMPWAGRKLRTYWQTRPRGRLDAATGLLRRGLAKIGRRRKQSRDDLEQTIETLKRSADEMTELDEMTRLLQTSVGIDELYAVVARYAAELFPGERGALYMIGESRNLMESAVAWGGWPETTEVFMPEDCWAVRLGKSHGGAASHGGPRCGHVGEFPPGGYLCVPMVVRGEILGVLHLRFESSPAPQAELWDAVDRSRRRLAQAIAERTALALSNLQIRESLRAQSVRDPLTGLYNRRFLDEAMEIESHRAQRGHTPIGVVMIDIDHFKRFNDSYGHAAGDALLRELGEHLREQVREEDIPCRYGGEEFIVILPGAGLEASRERAEALRSGIGNLSFDYQGRALGPITLSMGVADYPNHGPTWQQTVKAADAALYRAKKEGRNRVCVAE